jgi:hypothetical protein
VEQRDEKGYGFFWLRKHKKRGCHLPRMVMLGHVININFHFSQANWFRAAQYCRFHGMHLASISSQEENDRLEKHIRDFGECQATILASTLLINSRFPRKGLGNEHFWTSGTDLADEGNFFWMANGRPVTFTNWNAGEPNNFRYENGEEENCLELWNRDGKGLKWNDTPCSFETYFVCEV